MKRTLDATFINEVVNHPEVHQWLGVEGEVDLTEQVGNPYNYTFVNSGGGFIAHQLMEGTYEVHTQFLPDKRHEVPELAAKALEFMFCNTNCKELVTQVPHNNGGAAALAGKFGFKPLFERAGTPRGPTTYCRLTLEEWVQRNEKLEEDGEWFHDKLRDAGVGGEHPHDPSHERAVGAAIRMVKAGNCVKAVDYYNKWALFAGYAPITLINDVPPVFDVVDAVVQWNGHDMEILSCP